MQRCNTLGIGPVTERGDIHRLRQKNATLLEGHAIYWLEPSGLRHNRISAFGLTCCLFWILTNWSLTMDNLSFRIKGAAIDAYKLKATLTRMDINVTQKTLPKIGTEQLFFSLPVGPYGARWLFRCNLTDGTIACSGGVTKTFFGHNVWVFNNEAVQVLAIMGIVRAELAKLEGIAQVPDPSTFRSERAELTAHYVLPEELPVKQALEAIDMLFMTLFPKRYSPPEGKTHDNPGVVRLGKTKSSRVCRLYDPASKFEVKLDHIPVESWAMLKVACKNHLRVEQIFNKRELEVAGLITASDWSDVAKVTALIANRYRDLGLSVEFKDTKGHFTPGEVAAKNPSFVKYLRHWFSGGVTGSAPNPRNGSANRFKQFMAEKGYRYDVSFSRHSFLVHGLHAVLVPDRAAVLPEEVRKAPFLFHKWWLPGN